MPRAARQSSHSGYLHLISRGIGKQILFEEPEDYRFFLSLLKRDSAQEKITVLAYCLMDNHVHLLVYDPENRTSVMMKRIGVTYSRFFNRKYERTGHLFQDRFKSENIEDERYLLTVFRYILNNPRKAGLSAAAYSWSSFALYESRESFVNPAVLRERIGDYRHYLEFLDADDGAECMEFETPKHDDAWAEATLCSCLQVKSGTELQRFDRSARNAAIRLLRRKGLTIRQIERITGISRGIIQSI